MNKEKIASRIKEAMMLRGMKQSDIVKKTNITKSALSSYLSGKYLPKQTNIYKLAECLNVNTSWLLGYDVPRDKDGDQIYKWDIIELPRDIKIGSYEFKKGQKIQANYLLNIMEDVVNQIEEMKKINKRYAEKDKKD